MQKEKCRGRKRSLNNLSRALWSTIILELTCKAGAHRAVRSSDKLPHIFKVWLRNYTGNDHPLPAQTTRKSNPWSFVLYQGEAEQNHKNLHFTGISMIIQFWFMASNSYGTIPGNLTAQEEIWAFRWFRDENSSSYVRTHQKLVVSS